jgi:hypothetical protein
MAALTRKTIVGVFDNRAAAEDALEELQRAGFRDDQLGIVAPEVDLKASRSGATDEQAETGAARGAAIGAATGAAAGVGIWGLTIASGLVLPFIGPVLAGGTLAVLLGSVAGGAATGGLVGALMGLDFTEDEARHYEGKVQGGHLLITVQAEGRQAEVTEILRRHGATTEFPRP